MEGSELRDLLEYLAKSQFVEFELEREGFRLRVAKASTHMVVAAPVNGASPSGAESLVLAAAGGAAPAAALAPAAPRPEEDLTIVTSPIVGTFYRTPSPDSPPFVEVGSRVKKGQVLCIVEAMKLMNEIESDVDDVIAEIYPQNAQPVQFGEPLFAIREAQ